jgi:heme o synthase
MDSGVRQIDPREAAGALGAPSSSSLADEVGVAGALPPLVGCTAVVERPELPPILLALLVPLRTPPHAWALARLAVEDDRHAGIPMLCAARGPRQTRRQILIDSLMLTGVSVLPFAPSGLSAWYLIVALILGGRFIYLAHARRDQPELGAGYLYHYSVQ